jgi:type IV secretion system protein VirB9
MRRLILALCAAFTLTVAAPALAEDGVRDARIVEVDYSADAVYRIAGAYRTATQVIFSPGETIRHVAVGDSVSWEVAAEGSVLFLKPRERLQATNLLVVTDRHGVARHYVFELTARDPRDRSAAAYQVRFRYPADDQAAAVASLDRAAEAIETRLTDLSLGQGAIEGPRNLAYSVQGAVELQPGEVSDNGRFTVLRFPGSQPIPAIFSVSETGEESLVPFDVRGEFVVIHGVFSGLRLRRGRAVLCVFNEAFDPRGASTGTGTASPSVERTLSHGARP